MNNILSYSVSPLVQHMFPYRQYLLGAPRYLPAHYRKNPVDVSEFSAVVFVAPVRETAQALGIAEGTVKSRTHYALRALKLALAEMGAV